MKESAEEVNFDVLLLLVSADSVEVIVYNTQPLTMSAEDTVSGSNVCEFGGATVS